MALDRPAEAWQAAQRLKDAGPFDYYRLTPAQHLLLQTAWRGLYPGTPYPCSTGSCPGRIREAHRQLVAELDYHISQQALVISSPPNTQPVELVKNTALNSAAVTTPAPGAPDNPATQPAANVGQQVGPGETTETATPSTRYRFAEGVTEVREFGVPVPHTVVTDKLVKHLLGISKDYRRLFVDKDEAAAEDAVNSAVAKAEGQLLGGTPGEDDGIKLPSPSALKGMNKDELTSQYRQELAADEVPADLTTNALIAAAIIAHREKLADA